MKRLKDIEDKNKEQLKAMKNKAEDIKNVTDFEEEPLSVEENALIEEVRSIQKDVDYRKLKLTGGNTVINLRMILVIINHLKSSLETFLTETCQ